MTTEPDGVDGTTSDGRCKNNQCDQRSHGTAFVDVKAFSLCGGSRATEKAACLACACGVFSIGLTPWLTGAGSRRLEGTNIGHENAEGMAYVGVRVEPPVRLGSAVKSAGSWRPKEIAEDRRQTRHEVCFIRRTVCALSRLTLVRRRPRQRGLHS